MRYKAKWAKEIKITHEDFSLNSIIASTWLTKIEQAEENIWSTKQASTITKPATIRYKT